jgi:hypothetical protein
MASGGVGRVEGGCVGVSPTPETPQHAARDKGCDVPIRMTRILEL